VGAAIADQIAGARLSVQIVIAMDKMVSIAMNGSE
jgi:hypothetical protein